jgi:hypothetical protein
MGIADRFMGIADRLLTGPAIQLTGVRVLGILDKELKTTLI